MEKKTFYQMVFCFINIFFTLHTNKYCAFIGESYKYFAENWADISQWAHHGQTTSKQRCINVIYVEITLFKLRSTMNCPMGCLFCNVY